jgi:hypothetical protein
MKCRSIRAVLRPCAAALSLCAAWLACACTPAKIQEPAPRDCVAMAGLRLENPAEIPSGEAKRQIAENARSRQTAMRVLARMDAGSRERLTAPYAKELPREPTEDDQRVVLQMKLNVLTPKSGEHYLLFFGHPDSRTALLAAQFYAEEIAASFPKNAPGGASPAFSLQDSARLISVPAPPSQQQ